MNLEVSALVRTHGNPYTLAACIESIARHPEIKDICVCTNERSTGPAHALAPALQKQYPQLSFHTYPHALLPAAEAAKVPLDHPGGIWNYNNFCVDRCKHDRILQVDADQVLVEPNTRTLLASYWLHPYLGVSRLRLTAPDKAVQVRSEPLYWNRCLGVRFYRYRDMGFAYLWHANWAHAEDWGPQFYAMPAELPCLLQYGPAGADDAATPYDGGHSPLVDLARVFAAKK